MNRSSNYPVEEAMAEEFAEYLTSITKSFSRPLEEATNGEIERLKTSVGTLVSQLEQFKAAVNSEAAAIPKLMASELTGTRQQMLDLANMSEGIGAELKVMENQLGEHDKKLIACFKELRQASKTDTAGLEIRLAGQDRRLWALTALVIASLVFSLAGAGISLGTLLKLVN